MSVGTAPVVRGIVAAAGAVVGALALVGAVGLSSAYAEPTPDPTPTSSVTPTSTPISSSSVPPVETVAPTPTPIPLESTTSSSPAPAVEATPTPDQSDPTASPTPTPEKATPKPLPTLLPTPRPKPAENQGVAALAEPVADERIYIEALTHCAGEGDTQVEVKMFLVTGNEDLALDYVLTDDQGITRTGTVTLTPTDVQAEEPEPTTLEFAGLPVGSYHIDFRLDGGGEPVTVQNFEILTCLDVAVSCHQVTFANPSTNPTVDLIVGNGPVEDDDFRDFDLEPGERRLFRTDSGVIRWLAGTLQVQAGENFSIAYAGEDEEVSVSSDCEPGPPAAGPDDGSAGPDVGLADTGGSAHATGGLVGGSVLAAAGVSLLLRRRLT